MRVRRMLLLALSILLATTAVTALLAPVEQAGDRSERGDSAATQAQAREAADSAEAAGDLEVLSAAEADQRVRLPVGQALRIAVEANGPVSVQLGEEGPVEHADVGAPAEFAVFGEPGFDEPVRLLESGRVIGRVTAVDPP